MLKKSSNPRQYIRNSIFLVTIICQSLLSTPVYPSDKTDKETTLVKPPWNHCYGLNRVGQTHLNLYSGYRKKFNSPQGIVAVKLFFNDKESPVDDDELTVYGVNSNSGEIIYNKSLVSVGFYGKKGSGDGEFLSPTGITANNEGLVAVGDTGNNRVVLLKNVENDLRFWKSLTFESSGRGLLKPQGVALEGDTLYVADSDNNRIIVADTTGRFIRVMHTGLPLVGPSGIAVISYPRWNFYNSRFFVVIDSLAKRLTQFDLSGKPLQTVRINRLSDRGNGFHSVAVDYYSNIFVTDTKSGFLYKLDRFLTFLTRVGKSNRLDQPRGITIYRRFGQVFIAERSGAIYLWVGSDVRNLTCRAEVMDKTIELHVRFLLTEHSQVQLILENEKGDMIQMLSPERFVRPGNVQDICHVANKLLPCDIAKCKYYLKVTAKPTYSSKRYLTVSKRVRIR